MTGVALDPGQLREDVVLRHPFRMDAVQGADEVIPALQDLGASLEVPPVEIANFGGNVAEARIWSALDGAAEGCTLMLKDAGRIAEIRVMLRPVHALRGWRDRLRAAAPEGVWDLPEDVSQEPAFDPDAPVDPHFSFEVAPEAVFNSPILSRKPKGAALVKTVIGHASATYGHRNLGPILGGGARRLSYWTGNVAGFPVELAALLEFDATGAMTATTVFMQPMPVVELFRDHLRVRLKDILDDSYFAAA